MSSIGEFPIGIVPLRQGDQADGLRKGVRTVSPDAADVRRTPPVPSVEVEIAASTSKRRASIYQIDPLHDPRWAEFVRVHPRASIFHTPQWLEALHRTYGYHPVALTTASPGCPLANGMVFCHVNSWLTGKRIVSVPFADHCDPLFDEPADYGEALDWMNRESQRIGGKYIEIRPIHGEPWKLEKRPDFGECGAFRLHTLDLRPPEDALLRSFSKSSVVHRLRHLQKQRLTYEEGTSPELLNKFYHLLIRTRRRHRVPPQPRLWYTSLLVAFQQKAIIRVISKESTPVAAILTISHNGFTVYKYGASDERHHHLAGTIHLLWKAMQDAKGSGSHTFDMGRSSIDNPGLINFKSNWGTVNEALIYWRSPGPSPLGVSFWSRWNDQSGKILALLPDWGFVAVGRALYRHVG